MGHEEVNKSPFNSELEYALRVIIILSEIGKPLTLERLTAYDFIAVYPTVFGIRGKNIHGDNLLKFSEFSVRRSIIKKGLLLFIRKGLVKMIFDPKGYLYSITETGMVFSRSIENEYVRNLKSNIMLSEKRFGSVNDKTLIKKINYLAVSTMEN